MQRSLDLANHALAKSFIIVFVAADKAETLPAVVPLGQPLALTIGLTGNQRYAGN
jgi:hypothetical protein